MVPFLASLIRIDSSATGKNPHSRFLSYEGKAIMVRTVEWKRLVLPYPTKVANQ